MARLEMILATVALLGCLGMVESKSMKAADGVFKFTNAGPFFTLPAKVGSQKKEMLMAIEGYYGATMVYGPQVKCSGSYCQKHEAFDKTKSSSWKQDEDTKELDFSLGKMSSGVAGFDTLQVGPFSFPDMFAIASSVTNNMLTKNKASGALAMWGPQDKKEDRTTMQMVVEMAAQPTITFFAPKDLEGDHTITIGAPDTENCASDAHVMAPSQMSLDKEQQPWTVAASGGFKWGKNYQPTAKANIALNPGSDYFVAPKKHANHIYKKLKAQYSSTYHGGLVDCSLLKTAKSIKFDFNGKTVSIKPKQYIKQFNHSTCLLNIYPDELDQWTFPYQFHQHYCVTYDYGKKMVSIFKHK